MNPYVKNATEMQVKKAKALAEEALRLSHFHASNDDMYNMYGGTYYGAQTTRTANE